MATLEGIIDSPENLEVKRALAVKMYLLDFKTEDICKLLNVSDSFVSKWKKGCPSECCGHKILRRHPRNALF